MPDGAHTSRAPATLAIPWMDPHTAASAFADTPVLALLDSTGPVHPTSRYSYLCIDPFAVLALANGVTTLNGEPREGDPLDILDALLARHRLPPDPASPPFRGGAVGYIGYEYGAQRESVLPFHPTVDDPPDIFMALYDLVIVFDRLLEAATIHVTATPEAAPARLTWAAERLRHRRQPAPLPNLDWRPAWTQTEYTSRLSRILDYIAAGDIFQANLTTRHTAERPNNLHPADVHAALRARNPAPFGAWLRCQTHDLCCSSPERFLRLHADGAIETRPIKGTAARHSDPTTDATAAAALSASPKDRAENVMIVDVLRHDIGRVATIGSVAAPALCQIESTPTLHHLVSQVTAQLRPAARATDLLRAALPGGSITGAPKRRAMQIIAELEAQRRGIYCGTVLWLGFDGAMDSNIVIRSLVLTPTTILAQAGGGIVADSSAEAEYAEMQLKLAPTQAIFGAPP